MKVNNIKSNSCVALFAIAMLMMQTVSADINSLMSGQISRTVSQEVSKNLSDKVIESSKSALPTVDKKLYAKADIRQAQKLLLSLGFKPGVADGLMGKKTRKAIRKFQESQGIKVEGVLTESLLQKLNAVN